MLDCCFKKKDNEVSLLDENFTTLKNKPFKLADIIENKQVTWNDNKLLKQNPLEEFDILLKKMRKITPFSVKNAQMETLPSIIYADEVSVLNEKSCKKT